MAYAGKENMKTALALVLTLLSHTAIAGPLCSAGPMTDQVTHVRDGDTIVVGTTPIRLKGIAAPERYDPLGPASTAAMSRLVLGRMVICELDGSASFDRCVGTCHVMTDIGLVMVETGMARDCPGFSIGRYADAEQQAANAGATIRENYQLPKYCKGR